MLWFVIKKSRDFYYNLTTKRWFELLLNDMFQIIEIKIQSWAYREIIPILAHVVVFMCAIWHYFQNS